MESKTNYDTKSLPQVIYRAVGWVAGTYQPSKENINTGIFVTEDSLSIPAKITGRLRGNLSKKYPDYASQPDFFSQPQRWTVYPKTEPLRFELVVMKPLAPEPEGVPPLDEFRIVGQIKSSSDGTATIRIQRNLPDIQGDKAKKYSFVLTLKGSLPDSSVGQVWALVVKRQAENLVIVAREPYTPSEEDILFLERNALKQAEVIEAAKNSTSDALTAELERSPRALEKELANSAKENNRHQTKGETELSPQSNAERVTQPNVTTESKRQLAAKKADTQQQSFPTEQQLHSTTNTTDTAESLSCQSKFLVESTPNPNAFARPQRQQPPKSSPNQHSSKKSSNTSTQKTQTTPATAKPKAHLNQSQPQQKKQLNRNSANVKPLSTKPAFQVKVDNRVYNGVSSVVMKNRLVYVDDKPVASGKMAIVLGSPILMQADGRVTQGENQALLIGK